MVGLILPGSPRVIYDQTASAATQIDITNLGGFKWLLLSFDLTVSAGQGLALRTSTDNGASYLAGADYDWMHTGSSASSGVGATLIQMGDNTLSTARFGQAIIRNLANANQKTMVVHNVQHSNPFLYIGEGRRVAATAENAIRLLVSGSGNFSGRVTLEGI